MRGRSTGMLLAYAQVTQGLRCYLSEGFPCYQRLGANLLCQGIGYS